MRSVIVVACALACGACVQETVRFEGKPGQQSLVRDGRPALISKKKTSLVMIRPAARQMAAGGRPVFVVGLRNLTKKPLEFRVREVAVTQVAGTASVPMKVLTYEDLVQEEKTKQAVAAVLIGAAAGLNAVAAADDGYGYSWRTTNGRTYETVSYSSVRARTAQRRAMRKNEKMIDAAIAQGQKNLTILERDVLKDNTLLPGEWYGGTLHLAPPARSESAVAAKTYTIALTVGQDRHEIGVVQSGQQ